ncbi:MAG: serpin family protein, partial [Peptostreptococcales bacterium]
GMIDAFDPFKADFSGIQKLKDYENLYISEVMHKTFISVDEHGTKAAAITKVGVNKMSMPMEDKVVRLDRPFVYAIVDNSTMLPIFIGTLMGLGED